MYLFIPCTLYTFTVLIKYVSVCYVVFWSYNFAVMKSDLLTAESKREERLEE